VIESSRGPLPGAEEALRSPKTVESGEFRNWLKEEHVKSLEPLLRRYSQIRHDYLMGRCGGPELDFRAASARIAESAQSLEADVRTYADRLRD